MDPGSLIIFVLPLLLLLWVFSRSRKRQREVMDIQSTIEPGRRVMMTSGVYGEIVSVGEAGPDENSVVVELAPGVRTTWARQAVARVLPEDEPGTDTVDVVADGHHAGDPVGDTAVPDGPEGPGPQRP